MDRSEPIADPAMGFAASFAAMVPFEGDTPCLALAWSAAQGRGPEHLPLIDAGILLGREIGGFPGGPLRDARMSREHAVIRREAGGWVVEDLGSRNGTRLNGEPVQGVQPLREGSVLRLGASLFVWTHLLLPDSDLPEGKRLVGSSEAMRRLRRDLAELAPDSDGLLVTGPPGFGLEALASELHRLSGRPGPLLTQRCQGVPEDQLLRSLLGLAVPGEPIERGKLQAADRGTLLFDEAAALPDRVQQLLLGLLEAGAYTPLGGTDPVPVDARLVLATSGGLRRGVERGRLRRDLVARLSANRIVAPPLRARREDLPALCMQLLHRRGEGDRRLRVSLLEALMLHDWPGDQRQLSDVLGAAVQEAGASDELALLPGVRTLLSPPRALSSR